MFEVKKDTIKARICQQMHIGRRTHIQGERPSHHRASSNFCFKEVVCKGHRNGLS